MPTCNSCGHVAWPDLSPSDQRPMVTVVDLTFDPASDPAEVDETLCSLCLVSEINHATERGEYLTLTLSRPVGVTA